jgi:hypothetical protein
MNKLQIGIPVSIGIIIAIIIVTIVFNPVQKVMEVEDLMNKEIIFEENMLPEIQEKLDEIKKNKLENPYTPKNREWITSGPFQLDRSEYLLGEKIFMRINELQQDEKGQIAFMRPLNNTHNLTYLTIPFDGMKKSEFNYYLQPTLSKIKEICSVEDIVGKWIIVFRGTQYTNLNFEINEKVIPGDEDEYINPVC